MLNRLDLNMTENEEKSTHDSSVDERKNIDTLSNGARADCLFAEEPENVKTS